MKTRIPLEELLYDTPQVMRESFLLALLDYDMGNMSVFTRVIPVPTRKKYDEADLNEAVKSYKASEALSKGVHIHACDPIQLSDRVRSTPRSSCLCEIELRSESHIWLRLRSYFVLHPSYMLVLLVPSRLLNFLTKRIRH